MLLSWLAITASAATLNVPADHPTVRDAVAAAADGDEVVVDALAYVTEDLELRIPVDRDLTIRGVNGIPRVPGFEVRGVHLLLHDLIVRAGFLSGAGVDADCPASVQVTNGGVTGTNLTFERQIGFAHRASSGLVSTDSEVELSDLVADDLYCVAPIQVSGGELTVSQARFGAPNPGDNDGSVVNAGAILAGRARVTLKDSTVTDRRVRTAGAIYALGGSVTVSDTTFADNGPSELFPVVGAIATDGADLYVANSQFIENWGAYGAIVALNGPAFTLLESVFTANVGALVGDLWVQGTPTEIVGCLFEQGAGNRAAWLHADGAEVTVTDSQVGFTNNLVSGPGNGSALFASNGATVDLLRTDIVEARASHGGAIRAHDASVSVRESDLLGNRAGTGGAIYIEDDGHVLLEDVDLDHASSLTANTSTGGLVALVGELGGSFTAIRSRLANGDAKVAGAIYSEAVGGNIITLDEVLAEGNTAVQDNFRFNYADEVFIRRSEFLGNQTSGPNALFNGLQLQRLELTCNRMCGNASGTDSLSSVYLQSFVPGPTKRLILRNNAWFGNSVAASSTGMAPASLLVYSDATGSVTLENNTVLDEAVGAGVYTHIENTRVSVRNNLFKDLNVVHDGHLLDGVVIDYNLYDDVALSSNIPQWNGPNDLYGSVTFQGWTPDDCTSNLWLTVDSFGRDAGTPELEDLDGSRSDIGAYGGPGACLLDADEDGSFEDSDCDDADPNNFPGNLEVCDGQDNDCDGLVDDLDPDLDPVSTPVWYQDLDGDGFGDPDTATAACAPPGDDWVSIGDDCDDGDDAIHPDADEICDGVDNDCDDLVDDEDDSVDASTGTAYYVDGDGDAYGAGDAVMSCDTPTEGGPWVTDPGDCDDADANNFPGNPEVCDGQDNDCDDLVDDADDDVDTSDGTAFYVDEDGDGHGTGDAVMSCDTPTEGGPWVTSPDDCDDDDANNFPGNPEVCDGQDNDCDGLVDGDDPDLPQDDLTAFYLDGDDDGYGDGDPTYACEEPAGGPWSTEPGDCDDDDANNFPGNPEVCDDQDNDCDDLVDGADADLDASTGTAFYSDGDGDGFGSGDPTLSCDEPTTGGPWSTDPSDCDDDDANNFPGNAEVCDGQDNDCDDLVDDADADLDASTGAPWYLDEDGDGHGAGDPTMSCDEPTTGGPWVPSDDDCDDADANNFPGNPEVCDGQDNDCDDLVDSDDPDVPQDDLTAFYLDGDDDGYGDGDPTYACDEPAGGPWSTEPGDCDDADGAIHPAATEVCDGQDNDCDDLVDDEDDSVDASTGTAFYADDDGDAYGAGAAVMSCDTPTEGGPWVTNPDDCDDGNDAIHPAATEVCDGDDNDCDDLVDDDDDDLDASTATTWYTDADNDGFGAEPSALTCQPPATGGPWTPDPGDCDDTDGAVNPDATEVCNGYDDDCDDLVDSEDPDVPDDELVAWYLDADGDGVGDGEPVYSCDTPPGGPWSTLPGDCNDGNSGIHPGAQEICNGGIDDDCDDLADDDDPSLDTSSQTTWYVDGDGDGYGDGDGVTACDPPHDGEIYAPYDGDCDDEDASIHPDATEICDGLGNDEDCDGLVDDDDDSLDASTATTWYTDADQDGFGAEPSVLGCEQPEVGGPWVLDGSDCDDGNAQVHPVAAEICNEIDDDCNEKIDDDDPDVDPAGFTTWYADADGDAAGDDATATDACTPPADDWVDVGGDCDDSDPDRAADCEVAPGPAVWLQGGCGCSSANTGPSGAWLLLGGLLALRRRRG